MYRRKDQNQMEIVDDFFLPFGGKLDKNNRWVKLAEIIPWDGIEEEYASLFSDIGAPGKPVRMALGALIIKEKMGFPDMETLDSIKENPCMQYLLGLKEYRQEYPFDPSLMVHFRKRLGVDIIAKITEQMVEDTVERKHEKSDKDEDDGGNPGGTGGNGEAQGLVKKESKEYGNHGKLILDATCAPADIHYPTDLSLLNDAREKSEEIMDILHKSLDGKAEKPRTYRKKARKQYLNVAKSKKPRFKAIRRGIKQQLQYLKRNLKSITWQGELIQGELPLTARQWKDLRVIHEIYRQQERKYRIGSDSIPDRIVSLMQPHVRPIVRGKARAEVEFGAKVSISVVNGYSIIDRLSWDAYNECGDLEGAVERYRERFGCYPEVVQADKLYRNRDNLGYCKENHIRLSGPALGRPKTDEKLLKEQKRQEYQDACQRNEVEGKFGTGKRKYGLARIMSRLPSTSECEIALQFLVMNLDRKLRLLLRKILRWMYWEFWRLEKLDA